MLGLVLYLVYRYVISQIKNNIITTSADDTAINTVGNKNIDSSGKLGQSFSKYKGTPKTWNIEID